MQVCGFCPQQHEPDPSLPPCPRHHPWKACNKSNAHPRTSCRFSHAHHVVMPAEDLAAVHAMVQGLDITRLEFDVPAARAILRHNSESPEHLLLCVLQRADQLRGAAKHTLVSMIRPYMRGSLSWEGLIEAFAIMAAGGPAIRAPRLLQSALTA